MTIELARKGAGMVSPNPLVGAVIVKNGNIIGSGWHQKFGGKHAEINAIESCSENVIDASLYVNLEPCSHYGKTPPCAEAIIKSGIKKVFIGTKDPNPVVSGRGIEMLKNAGIEVKSGILENECYELNKFFFKHITEKMPFITLKIAQTIDGKIADSFGNSKWISSRESRKLVHRLRSEYDAVMAGKGTVKADNPELNVRLFDGKDPNVIIIDRDLGLDSGYRVFNENKDRQIFIISCEYSKSKTEKIKIFENTGVKILFVPENENGYPVMKNAFQKLAENNITSILAEGGSAIFSAVLRENLVDEILLFVCPKILGKGLSPFEKLPALNIEDSFNFNLSENINVGGDVLLKYKKV